jgi:hypothetical protein
MIRERALKVLLVLSGLVCLAGVYPLAGALRDGVATTISRQDQMILGIYISLGVFLLIAPGTCVSIAASFSLQVGPAVLPRVMPHPVLHLEGAASIEVANVDLQAAIKVLWMHVLGPAIA